MKKINIFIVGNKNRRMEILLKIIYSKEFLVYYLLDMKYVIV